MMVTRVPWLAPIFHPFQLLKNREPADWRDVQQMEHVLGKYIISERPMTEEEWTKARAVDVTPDTKQITDEKK
jgi:hypothetical protein